MECEHVRDQLSEYIDGELSGETAAAVAGHLESCPGCSQVLDDMTNLVGLMRDMDTIDEPADLAVNVRARLGEDAGATPGLWSRVRAVFAPPAVRIPAAAAAVAAVLLMVFYLPSGRETGSLIPSEVGLDEGSVREAPARVQADADAEGGWARGVGDEAAGTKEKRDKKGSEVDQMAATEEKANSGLRDDVTVPKQEPVAPAPAVGEMKQVKPESQPVETAPVSDMPASATAETAPTKDSPAAPKEREAEKSAVSTEALEEEPDAGRQEHKRIAAPPVDDVVESLAVTESEEKTARFQKLSASDMPAPEPAFGGTLDILAAQDSLVAAAVDSVGGAALRGNGDDEAPSNVVLVAIPANRYREFLKRLDAIGVPRDRLPGEAPGGIQAVTVKIVIK